ncbi:mediator of RNA polymerase II transcription subunit 25-like isoform X2 [Trifolium pratense]|uniref:mediator of RNA polymerase II transcription subunit 25-like isoform X2 n=1 Tax=Trifolium pratense TaxID=57577 RepID=UPI001E6941EF|nr:mediator of RNA polymerase II transcription subunit 25-like isoform X2 [Trifolium pratense]
MQFINWTKDVNRYMESLSHLSFNGNDLNHSSMAEGLAEALVMYPKPCDTMTEKEYYNDERHCILVALGDPVPKKIPVCVPMIKRAQLIGQRLQACNADFLEVAQKCVPLAVSLSVITPNPVPIFGAIFNMGNNVLTLSNAPISSYSIGQFTVLLSKNFKEAHNALNGKTMVEFPSTTPIESINAGADTTIFNVLNLQEQQVSSVAASEAMIGEQIHEVSNAVMPDTVSTAQPHDSSALIFSTDLENVASPSSEIRINLFDDIMTDFPPNKRSKSFVTETELLNLLELEENTFGSINDYLGQDQGVSTENQISAEEALKGYENELGEALNVAPIIASNDQTFNVELTASSSQNINIPPEQVQVPAPEQVQVPVSNTGEGSSTGLLHGNALESWYNPQAMMNTSTLAFRNFPTSVSNGNSTFSSITGNSQMLLQQNSSLGNLPMQHQQNSSLQLQQNSSLGNLPMQFQPNSSLGNSPMQFQQNSPLGNLPMQFQQNSPLGNSPMQFQQNSPPGNSPMQFQQNSLLESLHTQLQQNSSLGNSQMQFQQNSSLGNSLMQFQQNSSLGNLQIQQLQQSSPQTQFSMFLDYSRGLMGNFAGDPIGQHLESYNQYLRNNNIVGYNPPAFGENGWLRAIPSYSLPYLSSNLIVPSIAELPNYIHTWEGNVAGKINSSRFTVMKAKAYRKTTAPITLTFRWGNRLEISHFMPQKAVNHTKRVFNGRFSEPLAYVFFHVLKYNSVDLYNHLRNKYLGARIDLQYQTIILTPAEREHYYVGTIFPGDTLFIEPSS